MDWIVKYFKNEIIKENVGKYLFDFGVNKVILSKRRNYSKSKYRKEIFIKRIKRRNDRFLWFLFLFLW